MCILHIVMFELEFAWLRLCSTFNNDHNNDRLHDVRSVATVNHMMSPSRDRSIVPCSSSKHV